MMAGPSEASLLASPVKKFIDKETAPSNDIVREGQHRTRSARRAFAVRERHQAFQDRVRDPHRQVAVGIDRVVRRFPNRDMVSRNDGQMGYQIMDADVNHWIWSGKYLARTIRTFQEWKIQRRCHQLLFPSPAQ